MRSRWFLVVPLTVMMLTAGCAVLAGGRAIPAPSLTPRSLTGQNVDNVLLGDKTLSRILKQPLNIDPRFPPRFGGVEVLQDAGTALPDGCLGVAAMLQQSVYQSSDVEEVAVQTWRHAAMSADLTNVTEAVVSLPTAADANALFATFSQQWKKCDGMTTPLPGSVFRLNGKITHVQASTSVLAATVSLGWASLGWTSPNSKPNSQLNSTNSDSESIPAGRAIGVQDNCLIEVEVDYFNSSNPSGHGPGGFNDSAVDVARAVMDKVGALI
jgi:hypothetical protein